MNTHSATSTLPCTHLSTFQPLCAWQWGVLSLFWMAINEAIDPRRFDG